MWCSVCFRLLLVHTCLLPIARSAPLPSSILALVTESAGAKATLTQVKTPQLGDLQHRFINLPASCEVLIAVNSSSVNPADLNTPGPFPQVMGSDLSGTILAVESSCRRLSVGDKVWADIGAVVTVRDSQKKGKENGAYAQIAVALETQVGLMPRNLDFFEAASLPKVMLTSYKALKWYGGAPYTSNKTVLILGGSGGCGITGIQLAKAFGATSILTTTSSSNADFVKRLGADVAIDYHTEKWWEVLKPGSVDVIYDTVGEDGTGDRAMQLLAAGGFYVTITGAMPSKPRQDVSSNMFINSNSNLQNVALLDELRVLVEEEKLRMPQVKVFALQDIFDAFSESKARHVDGKLVVEMPPLSNKAATCEHGQLCIEVV